MTCPLPCVPPCYSASYHIEGPPSAALSPSLVAARAGRGLPRPASGRRPAEERRWSHSSLTYRRKPPCANWLPRCCSLHHRRFRHGGRWRMVHFRGGDGLFAASDGLDRSLATRDRRCLAADAGRRVCGRALAKYCRCPNGRRADCLGTDDAPIRTPAARAGSADASSPHRSLSRRPFRSIGSAFATVMACSVAQ
jgi:hypothetical protein